MLSPNVGKHVRARARVNMCTKGVDQQVRGLARTVDVHMGTNHQTNIKNVRLTVREAVSSRT